MTGIGDEAAIALDQGCRAQISPWWLAAGALRL